MKLIKKYLIGGTTPMYYALNLQKTGKVTKLLPTSRVENNTNKAFLTGLNKYKSDLMKEYGISDKEYNMLTRVALGIFHNESKKGKSYKYLLKGSDAGQAFIYLAKKGNLSGSNEPSRGVTQIKYNLNNSNGIFSKHGISPDDLWDNEKSGYATMLKLISDYNNLKSNINSGKYTDAITGEPLSTEAVLLQYWNSPIHLIKHEEDGEYVNGGDASESYGYISAGLYAMPMQKISTNNKVEYFGPRMHP